MLLLISVFINNKMSLIQLIRDGDIDRIKEYINTHTKNVVNECCLEVDSNYTNPLVEALKNATPEILELLLKRGAHNFLSNSNIKDAIKRGVTYVELLMKYRSQLTGFYPCEYIKFAIKKNESVVPVILKSCCNAERMEAFSTAMELNHVTTMRYIINTYGANIRFSFSEITLLSKAVFMNRIDVIKLLIDCGADNFKTESSGPIQERTKKLLQTYVPGHQLMIDMVISLHTLSTYPLFWIAEYLLPNSSFKQKKWIDVIEKVKESIKRAKKLN